MDSWFWGKLLLRNMTSPWKFNYDNQFFSWKVKTDKGSWNCSTSHASNSTWEGGWLKHVCILAAMTHTTSMKNTEFCSEECRQCLDTSGRNHKIKTSLTQSMPNLTAIWIIKTTRIRTKKHQCWLTLWQCHQKALAVCIIKADGRSAEAQCARTKAAVTLWTA